MKTKDISFLSPGRTLPGSQTECKFGDLARLSPNPSHLLFAAWGSTPSSTSILPVQQEPCPRVWKELESQGILVSQVGISLHAEEC